jgi:hypothetical protein
MNIKYLILLLSLFLAHRSVAGTPLDNPQGLIRDEKTAIKMAELLLVSVYGEDRMRSGRPYHAQADGDRWYVFAHIPRKNGDNVNMFGGGYHITFSRKDARVIEIGLDE